MDVTPAQLNLLHHTLGLRPDRRTPYRNHFVAGPGHHDMPDLEALEAAGLMARGRTPGFCNPTDIVFLCTDAGRAWALEHLPPEPKRTRYQEYMRDDFGHSFAEWLGINKPKIEVDGYVWSSKKPPRYRMYREQYDMQFGHYRDVQGEWAPTKKAAKASYKEALKRRREKLKEA